MDVNGDDMKKYSNVFLVTYLIIPFMFDDNQCLMCNLYKTYK